MHKLTTITLIFIFLAILIILATSKNEDVFDEVATINIVTWEDDFDMIRDVTEGFYLVHPKINVNIQVLPSKDYDQVLADKLYNGDDIDVIGIGNNAMYSDLVSKDALEPLNLFIEKDNFDIIPFGTSFKGLTINNTAYAIPYRLTTWVMFYNKDLFDSMGVEYPSNNMTWEEFRLLAAKMTVGQGKDKQWGAYIHTWPINIYGPAVQTGSTFIDEDLSAFQKALEFRIDLENDGSIMPFVDAVVTGTHYNAFFQKGNVAMNLIGDWHIIQLRNAAKEGTLTFDWDIAQMPHPVGSSPNTTWGMTTTVGINSASLKKDAAWKFVSFMGSEKAAEILALNGVVTGYMNENIKAKFMSVNKDSIPENISILFDQKVYIEYPPIIGINNVIYGIYKEESELALSGKLTPEEAFIKIKKRIIEEQ